MAAKTSSTSKNSIATVPVSAAPSSKDVQDFFQRIYTQLKEGQLQTALDLIDKEGDAYHKNLGGNNKQPIIAFISKEGLTDDQRACKFVTILKKFQNLFPEVKPDDFEAARMRQNDARAIYVVSKMTSSATTSASQKAVSDAEAVKKVKALGMQAGLSESEVENSLEEIILNDGSRTWMIKTEHNDQYKAWEDALIKLAARKELIFFCESHIRHDREEHLVCMTLKQSQKGFFRGLETEVSSQQMEIINGLIALAGVRTGKKTPDILRNKIHQIIFNIALHAQAKKDLAIAAKQSKTAALVQRTLQTSVNKDTYSDQLHAISNGIFEKLNLADCEEFLTALAYTTFHTHSSSESEEALKKWRDCYKESERSLIDIERPFLLDKFVAAWRKVRDPAYARIFQSERAKMPEGIPTFVLFGSNHAPGFKQALIALGTKSAERKDPGDSKEGKK